MLSNDHGSGLSVTAVTQPSTGGSVTLDGGAGGVHADGRILGDDDIHVHVDRQQRPRRHRDGHGDSGAAVQPGLRPSRPDVGLIVVC